MSGTGWVATASRSAKGRLQGIGARHRASRRLGGLDAVASQGEDSVKAVVELRHSAPVDTRFIRA